MQCPKLLIAVRGRSTFFISFNLRALIPSSRLNIGCINLELIDPKYSNLVISKREGGRYPPPHSLYPPPNVTIQTKYHPYILPSPRLPLKTPLLPIENHLPMLGAFPLGVWRQNHRAPHCICCGPISDGSGDSSGPYWLGPPAASQWGLAAGGGQTV